MAIKSIDDLLTADQETNIQQQARNAYTPSYNAAVLSANQSYENQKASYENAYAEYEASAEKSKKEAVQTVTDNSVKRGMGRSSRIDYEMAESLGDIAEQVLAYRKQVDAQITSLAQQKDASLAQLSADFETNVLNQAYTLRSQAIENAQWLAEFNASQSSGGSGGSSGTSGIVDLTGTTASGSTATPNGPGTGFYNGLLYQGGNPFTGTFGGKYYRNGKAVSSQSAVSSRRSGTAASTGQFSSFNYVY